MNVFDPSSSTLDHDFTAHQRQFAGDEKLFVQFYNGYVPLEQETLEAGRPIFKDVVMIRIITPGNRDNIVDRESQPFDKIRFRAHWERYQKGESEIGDGTRLVEWPLVSRSMAEELRFVGFHTVEQVAEANDGACFKVTGLRELKARATAWLQATKDTEATAKLLAEKEAKESEIAALKAQIAELAKLVKAPEGGTPLAGAQSDSTGGIAKAK